MGSPIGMFMAVRGVESLGEGFKLPACPTFLNIFHPSYWGTIKVLFHITIDCLSITCKEAGFFLVDMFKEL